MKIIKFYLLIILLLPIDSIAESQPANYIVIDGNARVSDEEIIEYSGYEIGKI